MKNINDILTLVEFFSDIKNYKYISVKSKYYS